MYRLPNQLTREDIETLDRHDPLAKFHDRFEAEDPSEIYLLGNSLGRLPKATRNAIETVTDTWGKRKCCGWSEWLDLPHATGATMGQSLLGAKDGEVWIGDTTSINLFKLCGALIANRGQRTAVVVDLNDFPTDLYVVEGLTQTHGLEFRSFRSDLVNGPTVDEIQELCQDGQVAVVVLSHVNWRSSSIADMAAITAKARQYGADVVWDLSHSVGAMAIDLNGSGAQFAVGCTYKYLNAGPGAPAFLYAAEGRLADLASPIWGWFGHCDQYQFVESYKPRPDAGRFAGGSINVAGTVAVSEGIKLLAEAGADRLREKSLALTEVLLHLYDEKLAPLGLALASPRPSERRGPHVAFRHPLVQQITESMAQDHNVICDFRAPDYMRFALAPINVSFSNVWDAVDALVTVFEQLTPVEQALTVSGTGRSY